MFHLELLVDWATQHALAFRDIETRSLFRLFNEVEVVRLREAEPLFFQGQPGDHYWVIFTGMLNLYIAHERHEERSILNSYGKESMDSLHESRVLLSGELGHRITSIGSGVGLGELSLLGIGSTDRTCAAVASKPTAMLKITHRTFDKYLKLGTMRRMDMNARIEFLHSVPAFSHWSKKQLVRIAYTLKEGDYTRGARIIRFGEPNKVLNFIRDGTVFVKHPRGKMAVASMSTRDLVGAESLVQRYHARANPREHIPEHIYKTTCESEGTTVVYAVDVDEAAKYLTGRHGAATVRILEETIALQQDWRSRVYGKMRGYQQSRKADANPDVRLEPNKSQLFKRFDDQQKALQQQVTSEAHQRRERAKHPVDVLSSVKMPSAVPTHAGSLTASATRSVGGGGGAPSAALTLQAPSIRTRPHTSSESPGPTLRSRLFPPSSDEGHSILALRKETDAGGRPMSSPVFEHGVPSPQDAAKAFMEVARASTPQPAVNHDEEEDEPLDALSVERREAIMMLPLMNITQDPAKALSNLAGWEGGDKSVPKPKKHVKSSAVLIDNIEKGCKELSALDEASAGLMAKLPVQKKPARLYTMEEYLQGIHLRKNDDGEPQT